jgi:SAM-dependent methyltransferase
VVTVYTDGVESGGEAARARQRDPVRRGYDAISLAYRGDGQAASASEDVHHYAGWVSELAGLLRRGARVVDLGCGAGIPATRELTRRGLQVVGVDFSAIQLKRAKRVAPAAGLVQADMAALQFAPASMDAGGVVLCADPRAVGRPAGTVPADPQLAASGRAVPGHRRRAAVDRHRALPGCRHVLDHAGTGSYLDWLEEAGFVPQWDRFIPEGNGRHSLILARAAAVP